MDWIRRWLIDSYIKREEWEKAKLDMSGYRDPIKGKRKLLFNSSAMSKNPFQFEIILKTRRKPEENPKKTRENQRKPKEKKTAAPPGRAS